MFKSIQAKSLLTTLIISTFSHYCSAQVNDTKFEPYSQNVPGAALQFTMIPVTGGHFLMGSPVSEEGREGDEGPQRQVHISPFWMGAYEVSRDEFDVFYKDESTSQNVAIDAVTRPSPQYIDFSLGMGKEGGYPVNSLSQYAALMYCRWLYAKTGIFYRLPTEAEWEYACRAGTNTKYYFGNDAKDLGKYAWYLNNSEEKFHKSGQKSPNAFGLYDMLGNVSEWTLDHYDENAFEKMAMDTTNPIATFSSSRYPKVLKGGSFMDEAPELRVANRLASEPSWNARDPQIPKSKWWLTEAGFVGFRLVRPLQAPTKEEADAFFNKYLGK